MRYSVHWLGPFLSERTDQKTNTRQFSTVGRGSKLFLVSLQFDQKINLKNHFFDWNHLRSFGFNDMFVNRHIKIIWKEIKTLESRIPDFFWANLLFKINNKYELVVFWLWELFISMKTYFIPINSSIFCTYRREILVILANIYSSFQQLDIRQRKPYILMSLIVLTIFLVFTSVFHIIEFIRVVLLNFYSISKPIDQLNIKNVK